MRCDVPGLARADRFGAQGERVPAAGMLNLEDAGIGDAMLSPEQVVGLATKAVSGLRPSQVAEMAPEALAEFSPAQIKALRASAVAALTKGQLAELTPAQLKMLDE